MKNNIKPGNKIESLERQIEILALKFYRLNKKIDDLDINRYY